MEKQQDREESQQLTLENYLCFFGYHVSTLCDQESDCQISPEDAYNHIKNLWLELRNARPEILNCTEEIQDI